MKDKDKKHKNNVTELKNSIVNMYEKYNVLLLNLEKTTSNKLDKMKEKITHVKKSLSVIPNKAGKNEKAMKIIISKSEILFLSKVISSSLLPSLTYKR